jgi:hypothetical protein
MWNGYIPSAWTAIFAMLRIRLQQLFPHFLHRSLCFIFPAVGSKRLAGTGRTAGIKAKK